MKISGVMFTACLLLASSAVITNAQEEKNDTTKPAQQESKPDVAKPDDRRTDKPARQEEGKPAQEDHRMQQQMKQETNDHEKQATEEKKQQSDEQKQDQRVNKNAQEQNRASGNSGKTGMGRDRKQSTQRIPDDKFREHFGREHHIRVSQPVVVEGRPRFQASGFWFEFVDPWPVGWSYSDDCYIEYIDGQYFLFDLLHPEVRVALIVVL